MPEGEGEGEGAAEAEAEAEAEGAAEAEAEAEGAATDPARWLQRSSTGTRHSSTPPRWCRRESGASEPTGRLMARDQNTAVAQRSCSRPYRGGGKAAGQRTHRPSRSTEACVRSSSSRSALASASSAVPGEG